MSECGRGSQWRGQGGLGIWMDGEDKGVGYLVLVSGRGIYIYIYERQGGLGM
jgi:hypothetical protein